MGGSALFIYASIFVLFVLIAITAIIAKHAGFADPIKTPSARSILATATAATVLSSLVLAFLAYSLLRTGNGP